MIHYVKKDLQKQVVDSLQKVTKKGLLKIDFPILDFIV